MLLTPPLVQEGGIIASVLTGTSHSFTTGGNLRRLTFLAGGLFRTWMSGGVSLNLSRNGRGVTPSGKIIGGGGLLLTPLPKIERRSLMHSCSPALSRGNTGER